MSNSSDSGYLPLQTGALIEVLVPFDEITRRGDERRRVGRRGAHPPLERLERLLTIRRREAAEVRAVVSPRRGVHERVLRGAELERARRPRIELAVDEHDRRAV